MLLIGGSMTTEERIRKEVLYFDIAATLTFVFFIGMVFLELKSVIMCLRLIAR
jgi:hypothetical protein